MSSVAALPSARAGLLPWSPDLAAKAADLTVALNEHDPAALADAVSAEALERLSTVLAAIDTYRRHPYRRDLTDPPVLWRQGGTRVLDYGGANSPGGPAVLFVPSLVNRGYVLDLSAERSMLRWLAGNGVRPLLVDWGAPGPDEQGWTLTDYIAGRLEDALDTVLAETGGPLRLAGYCMGGNLALALAARRPDAIDRLALLATPWDFHAGNAARARMMATASRSLEPVMQAMGELPIDVLQTFFLALDPALTVRKFLRFARLDPGSVSARQFVALEDWLNDGVPLAADVARECLSEWYGDNTPGRGLWRVAGEAVRPETLAMPTLLAIPSSDRIVPPDSARALADRIPDATLLHPPSGHIGMVVGARAERGLWAPLRDWLRVNNKV